MNMQIHPGDFYQPNIALFSGTKKEHSAEEFVREHVLCHIIAGELRFTEADTVTIGHPGDTILFRRNLLVKCEKRPPDGQPFKIIYFILEKTFLQQYAIKQEWKKPLPDPHREQVLFLQPQAALKGLFHSIYPYFEPGVVLSPAMKQHKLVEAIIALQEQQQGLGDWLLDFSEQEKIDLEEFMQRNYMFNVPVTKFAELSGRSLSTFQRDFRRTFGTNAASWLLKRRLQAAHHAIALEQKMPVNIYLDLGFEDIAHFSRSFKHEFGMNPSQLLKDTKLQKGV